MPSTEHPATNQVATPLRESAANKKEKIPVIEVVSKETKEDNKKDSKKEDKAPKPFYKWENAELVCSICTRYRDSWNIPRTAALGHTAENCPKKGDIECFKCHRKGHERRDCTAIVCKNCERVGHK
jgi:hypothetical protein